jgi:hypothetical protein
VSLLRCLCAIAFLGAVWASKDDKKDGNKGSGGKKLLKLLKSQGVDLNLRGPGKVRRDPEGKSKEMLKLLISHLVCSEHAFREQESSFVCTLACCITWLQCNVHQKRLVATEEPKPGAPHAQLIMHRAACLAQGSRFIHDTIQIFSLCRDNLQMSGQMSSISALDRLS